MKIYKPIGSKDRFLEMFQKVTKVKLNEDFNQGGETNNILEKEFDDLNNGRIRINNNSSQVNGDESFVEINCTDTEGNTVVFRFKANSSQGDQDGVYGVNNVQLINFKFNGVNGQTMDLDESSLQQFNADHNEEMLGIVSDFVDVEPKEDNDELYEDAIKVLDSYPYGGGRDGMQTGKAYVDQKPTNSALRVDAPELNKYVNEIDDEDYAIANQELQRAKQELRPIQTTTPDDKIDIEEPEEVEEVSEEKRRIIQQAYDILLRKNPHHAPTIPEVTAQIERMTGQQVVTKQRAIPKFAERYFEEGVADLQNVGQKYFQTVPEEKKKEYIQQAIDKVNAQLGPKINEIPRGEYIRLIKYIAEKLYVSGLTDMNEEKDINTYPDTIGSEFKSDTNYPIKKKKHVKKVKIKEGNGNELPTKYVESTKDEKYEDVVFMQGEEADEPLELLNNQGKDAAMEYLKQWHNPGQHMGRNELGHGNSDQTYEKDGYIMSWNSRLGYIGLEYDLSRIDEKEEIDIDTTDKPNSGASDTTNVDGMSLEPKGDEIAQLAQDKEEAGEMLQGGLGDGKSPLEFDPDQILRGLDVEKEHSDNPLIALEIVIDHLTENPEYYTTGSAQMNAAGEASGEENGDTDDKETTDALLGYKAKNVGDVDEDIVGASGAQNAVGGQTTPAGAGSDDAYNKYLDYKKKDFNELPDNEKEDFFELWKQYKDRV